MSDLWTGAPARHARERVCEHMFVREYRFTITEHDAERPWIVLGSEHHTAALEDGVSFFAWAHERWPPPRWTVELDPWQLGEGLPPCDD
jgi:hypothetical protein